MPLKWLPPLRSCHILGSCSPRQTQHHMRPGAERGWKSWGVCFLSDPAGWVLCMLHILSDSQGWGAERFIGASPSVPRAPGAAEVSPSSVEGDSCAEITPTIRYPGPAPVHHSWRKTRQRVSSSTEGDGEGSPQPCARCRGVPQPAPNWGAARGPPPCLQQLCRGCVSPSSLTARLNTC